MKYPRYILLLALLAQPFYGFPAAAIQNSLAEWSIGTYIQADNDLAPFATYNVKDMETAATNRQINMLIQWDQPHNQKTWRYRVTHKTITDIGSLNQEMGINPAKELVDFMTIIYSSFPAKKYGYVLWNHGNGALDRSGTIAYENAWLSLPSANSFNKKMRGILYDYSEKTYLATSQLHTVFNSIKNVLGQKLDLLGMDACLMAMMEVAYEVKDSVNYLVTSQQTEDGLGWPYGSVLKTLSQNPTIDAPTLGKTIVQQYDNLYSQNDDNFDPGRTQSTINLQLITSAAAALESLSQKILTAQGNSRIAFTSALKNARAASTEFYINDYIDLYSFYLGLEKELNLLRGTRKAAITPVQNKKQKPTSKLPTPTSKVQKNNDQQRLAIAAQDIMDSLTTAKTTLLASIVASKAGEDYNGAAYGLSIYFPSDGNVDRTYAQTNFALQTSWTQLVASVR